MPPPHQPDFRKDGADLTYGRCCLAQGLPMSARVRIPDARTELGHAKPPARALKAVKAANEGSKNAAVPGRFLRRRRRPDVADVASRKTLR